MKRAIIDKDDLAILRLRIKDALEHLSREFQIRLRLGRFLSNKTGFHSTLDGGEQKARRKK